MTDTTEKTKVKKIITNLIIPIAVTIAVLFIFFREISFSDILENFLKIPVSYLLGFVFLSMTATVLRAWKYHILLSRKLTFKDVFLITLVRNFSVDLLPARSASLVFYSWLAKKRGISIEEGGSSFVVSVFYDGLALAVMLGGLLFFLETGVNRAAIYIGMAFIFCLSVVMIFFAQPILHFILKWSFLKRFTKIFTFLENIETYLGAHKSNKERGIVFLLSLGIRGLKYLFVFLLFEGVVGIGFSFRSFSLFSFGLAGTELSSLIPIQGIGGFGTWELAFSYIFQALQITADNLKAAGFVIHITTQVWEYSIGLLAFLYFFVGGKKSKENG